jgi:predicted permease
MLRDLIFSCRHLARAPGFTVAAVLTLALGTGANTAIFSLINGFLRPLPVPDADQIVILAASTPGDETGFRYRFSLPALKEFREQATVFSDVFAFDIRLGGLGVDGRTTQFTYCVVTGNFFSGLGLKPAAGRFFEPGEGEAPGSDAITVLGHAYWMKRFGGDRNIVGSTVRLDGHAARVIGVAPAGFHGLIEGADMEGYVPLGAFAGLWRDDRFFTDRTMRPLTAAARLKPGVTVEASQTEVDLIARRLAESYPSTDGKVTVRVLPERQARPVPLPFMARIQPAIKALLFALGALVLLIACMNVVNLLLVRATVRQRELAVRASLGSSRARLIRLLLTESFVLAIAGAGIGLLMGQVAVQMLLGQIDLAGVLPFSFDAGVDWPVFLFALSTALATGVLIGVLPALRASRAKVTDLLHDGGRAGSAGGGRARLRSLLVVAQVAGSLVLLIVASVFVRNLRQAQAVNLGFDPDQMLIVRLDPHQIGYDLPRAITFYDELERRLGGMAGAESVSMAFTTPLSYIFGGYAILREGEVASTDSPPAPVGCNSVSSTYFEMMRLPIVRGRSFGPQDLSTSKRVVIVNETLAARLWPGQDPIGKRFDIRNLPDGLWEVVGVARDSKYIAVFEDPLPYFYMPLAQNPSFLRVMQVRSSWPPETLAANVLREIAAIDSDMPVAEPKTMRQTIDGGLGFLLFRIGAMQAGALGILGLIVASVGVYGVLSYSASQRAREIGIRLALGASQTDVGRLILRQGAVLVLAGIGVGLAGAIAITQIIGKFLLLATATEPMPLAGVTVLLAAIALAACYVPAWRAMRTNPMESLRHE